MTVTSSDEVVLLLSVAVAASAVSEPTEIMVTWPSCAMDVAAEAEAAPTRFTPALAVTVTSATVTVTVASNSSDVLAVVVAEAAATEAATVVAEALSESAAVAATSPARLASSAGIGAAEAPTPTGAPEAGTTRMLTGAACEVLVDTAAAVASAVTVKDAATEAETVARMLSAAADSSGGMAPICCVVVLQGVWVWGGAGGSVTTPGSGVAAAGGCVAVGRDASVGVEVDSLATGVSGIGCT